MKDRTREAVFNLLGPGVKAMHVWDLFAGTGAMGLEAISRGAAAATLFERHIGTAKLIAQNVATLGLQDRVRIIRGDVFKAIERELETQSASPAPHPWLIFCCPPYAFYDEQLDALGSLLGQLREAAPPGSLVVVEAALPFDFATLWPGEWSGRDYPPATIGIFCT